MTTDQIRTRMGELRTTIEELAKVEGDLDETQRTAWASSTSEYDTLDGQLTKPTAPAQRRPALPTTNASSTLPEAERAALNEGSTTQGGFLVPPFLDPTIILTNVGTTNPFRSISTVKSIMTQTWKGVTSAGVTAEWTAEASEMT